MGAWLLLVLGPSVAAVAGAEREFAPEREFAVEEIGVTFDMGAFDAIEVVEPQGGAVVREWRGRLGECELAMALLLFPASDYLTEPSDSAETLIGFLREDGVFEVEEAWYPTGKFGSAPFAAVNRGPLQGPDGGAPEGAQYVLGGLTPAFGYALHVECRPAPDEAAAGALRAFLEHGIAYAGEERAREWTDAEALARWVRDAPAGLHEAFARDLERPGKAGKIVARTDNYLVLSNSGGVQSFAKILEENYDEIREMFPFEEVPGYRLMPIFLFRTPDDYYGFCEKITGSSKRNSKGHAWRDYYATYYEAPNDPTHIHEQVHQIFDNRLRLGGGGSWYQEGVAEYVETRASERNIAARLVRDGEAVPLRELVALKSLLDSSVDDVSGASAAGNAYKQSALLIEFLRESRFGKQQFEAWLHAMGKVPRNDVESIEAVFQRFYGTGLEGIEEQWRAYCAKR